MQSQKVPMSKKQFRIGDLADELKVKKFVIRFWEKEFDIQSDRSQGGQRFYTTEDLKKFLLIKDLLYAKGFTIAGAKKQLESLTHSHEAPAQEVLPQEQIQTPTMQAVEDPVAEILSDAGTKTNEAEVSQDQTAGIAVTPATKEPCSCSLVFEQLQSLKEQLAHFKKMLNQ